MMPCSVRSTSDVTGSSGLSVVGSEEDVPVTDVPKGLGPRIYVGGIPNALSQTMIRNHFSHYGKVVDVYFPKHPVTHQRQAFCFVTFSTKKAADVAVSQSNRKINGQLVSSIAPTDDRPMHHRSGQHPAPSPSTLPDPLDFRSQLCNAYARAGLGPDHLPSAALQQSLPTQNVWPGPPSLAPSMEACMGLSSTTGLQTLLQLSYPLVTPSLINTNPGLALLLAANSQGSAALRGGWGDSSLPMDMPACTAAYLRHAALASSMAPYGNPGMHTEEAAMAHHYMTASELASQYMANDTFPNYLSATGFVGPRLAPQPWLDLADGLYQPSVPLPPHISSNLHVENALSEAVISGNHLCFGPQRHGHARDVRHARHSPY